MMQVRLLGLAKFVAGSIVTIGVYYYLVWLDGSKNSATRNAFAEFLSLPTVFAMIGLIELIAGVKFYRVAAKWDEIHEGIRWSISFLFILILVVLFYALLIFILRGF